MIRRPPRSTQSRSSAASDVYKRQINAEYMGSIQWVDPTNERFINWMRTAALPRFRKLWGRIEEDLVGGKAYTLRIQNNYNVTAFEGKKSFVLSTANAFGGKNMFLAVAYLVVGSFCLVVFALFLVKKYVSPSKFKEIEEKLSSPVD
eukprot:TRINITY_DN6559_c0_g1_i2.p1 TRINITY_DN6559_c0_g1~~TRINITY_DN6559_c0_g1_i2.p1  ORF type:complete len:147 (+),score=36.31 TRINITY_DN6559_c0_g1_i2:20-460(+)